MGRDTPQEVGKTPALPSSSVTGFFQERPSLGNQFDDDVTLRRVFSGTNLLSSNFALCSRSVANKTFVEIAYLPTRMQKAITPDLSRFGDKVISQPVLAWIADAERNSPYLRTWDTWGKRKDDLVTSEGWRQLQDLGISEGTLMGTVTNKGPNGSIVALAYENEFAEYSRVVQFIKYHIWTGSCAYVTCPSAMTDGAARLLSLNTASANASSRPVFEAALRRLTSRDPKQAWTSGQWMTERAGGSDVSETETQAKMSHASGGKGVDGAELGPWNIDGFKWFSSATDSSMTVLLAKTPNGLSAFYAPMRRMVGSSHGSELNGIHIQRLKSKLGTRPLPTAELELKDMRAWMVGQEGQGVKQISTILNITRVHNAITAVGLWGRGLAVSRAFARVRRTRGKALMDTPAHVRTMAKQHVEYRAMMHLAHFTTYLLGMSEQPSGASSGVADDSALPVVERSQAQHLLRLFTPVGKALTAKAAIRGLAECMESLGGVGYLENEEMEFNIARLFRDVNVLSIWEGTTDIMALDVIRVFTGKTAKLSLDAMQTWVSNSLANSYAAGANAESSALRQEWDELKRMVYEEPETLVLNGREVLYSLGHVICGVLLLVDHQRDEDPVAGEISRRWIHEHGKYSPPASLKSVSLHEIISWDRKIVFGDRRSNIAKL
ncbi:MAG: hypothetical protein M4579_002035 [Chaenotheca gracillima]|nr:MAG: hypothetical protein M4579_002035 [Chaenotheca gracillima]